MFFIINIIFFFSIICKNGQCRTSRLIKYLHDINIIHRDLSSHNLLLYDNLYLIITDFGITKYFEKCHSKIQSLFGSKPPSVTSIGYYIFCGCSLKTHSLKLNRYK